MVWKPFICLTNLLTFNFLAVDRLSSLILSSGINDGATKQNPTSSVQGMSNEGQVISRDSGNIQIPITNTDDMLCSDESRHIQSSKTPVSKEPVSCCSSQPTVALPEKAGFQVIAQSSPLDYSIVDADKVDEKGGILSVETPHENQPMENHSERRNAGPTCMYPDSDDSDSSSDSSVIVNKMADSKTGLHEPSSDEEEVEICLDDAQQPASGGKSCLRLSPTGSSPFQRPSSQNTKLDMTSEVLYVPSNVLLRDKDNCVTKAQSTQHSQVFKVSSAQQSSQSSNSSVPVSSIGCHVNSAIDLYNKVTACAASNPASLSVYSSSAPPDTHCVTQCATANVQADTSVASDLLKNLNTQTPHLPSLESDTSGSSISTSETRVSVSMKNMEKVLECSPNLNPHASSYLLDNSDLKLKVESQIRPKTNSPKLKGLSIKSKSKPEEESFQKPSSSENQVLANTKAALNQPTKLPPITTMSSFLQTSNQPNTNNCHSLPKVSEGRQIPPEHGHSGDTLQTVKLAKEKDVHLGSKTPAKSNGQAHQLTTQRTFIEVRLSSLSGSSSPVMARNESVHFKHAQRGTDRSAPVLSSAISTEVKTSSMSSITEYSLCSTKEDHSLTTSNGSKPSPVETSETIKSSTSRLYVKTTERRSFSTDTALSAEYNPFSVRHKIKSFENLANFDKPMSKSSDSQSYALTYRASLNQRIAGYMGLINSGDCQTRHRSSYVESLLPTTPSSPLLGKSPHSITLINLELPHTGCRTTPLTEAQVQKASDGISTQTPPVLRRKHNKIPSNRLRQLRALSMPELEKLCTEDFTAVDNTQASIHQEPTKLTEPESFLPPVTLTKANVNRVSQGDSRSTEETPLGTSETRGQQLGWSIRWEALLKVV